MYGSGEITEEKSITENEIDQKYLNTVVCKDSSDLRFLPNESVHLVVTSPPYNVTKEYDADLTLNEYLILIEKVMAECYSKLVRGGRLCLNVANIGRKPYIALNSSISHVLVNLGYLMRGEIIWNKSASAGSSTAWGSWQSASNPTLRDVHEYILVFSKGQFSRVKDGKDDSIAKEDFLELTKSIWSFPAESAKRIGHPAPFPLELPRRCIELFSFRKDIVLDPFNGSGTTCLAALKLGRRFLGIDISEEYCDLARIRIRQETQQKKLADFIH